MITIIDWNERNIGSFDSIETAIQAFARFIKEPKCACNGGSVFIEGEEKSLLILGSCNKTITHKCRAGTINVYNVVLSKNGYIAEKV